MSRRRKRGWRKRRGNIEAQQIYDPFPPSGLVKQYKPFILKELTKYCRQYPGLSRQELLFRAVELGLAAEKAFKPELGYDFSTLLRHRLKELHRLHDEQERGNSSPVHYAKGELEQDRAEELGEEVELDFSGGGNATRLTFDQQWWLPRLCSNIVNYIDSLRPFAVDELEIKTFKTCEFKAHPWLGRDKPRNLARDEKPRCETDERTNYTQSYADNLIPTLASRHRVAAGVQLRGSDNAPAVQQRISADLPEVVRQQPVGEILKGWIRAVFDHLIRRQREADDEAQKRLAGDYSPTFLEADRNAVDLRFPGARRPPRYLKKREPFAWLDAPMDESGEDGTAPRSLHEIVGDSSDPNFEKQVDTMRQAVKEVRPSLPDNEVPIADRMLDILDGHRSYSQGELAAEIGLSEGQVSKLWHRVAGKVAEKIRGRNNMMEENLKTDFGRKSDHKEAS